MVRPLGKITMTFDKILIRAGLNKCPAVLVKI